MENDQWEMGAVPARLTPTLTFNIPFPIAHSTSGASHGAPAGR
jgi:hypothetical protein